MAFQLPQALLDEDDERALQHLRDYFTPGRFTGASFDTWDSDGRRAESADRFTADDLVAVTFLSVNVPPRAAQPLLDRSSKNEFNALLSQVPEDRDLADEPSPPSPGSPTWQLDTALRNLPDVGRTIGSKLMARKRPRLIPVYDSVVSAVMSLHPEHWVPLHASLRANGGRLQQRLLELKKKGELPAQVSALRVLDVIAWMEGRRVAS